MSEIKWKERLEELLDGNSTAVFRSAISPAQRQILAKLRGEPLEGFSWTIEVERFSEGYIDVGFCESFELEAEDESDKIRTGISIVLDPSEDLAAISLNKGKVGPAKVLETQIITSKDDKRWEDGLALRDSLLEGTWRSTGPDR